MRQKSSLIYRGPTLYNDNAEVVPTFWATLCSLIRFTAWRSRQMTSGTKFRGHDKSGIGTHPANRSQA